ncbi:MAG: hypothetical protein DI539_10765 [Flavobacterium psychrophilum]|nr:MAG: hypothetical protein DI539_10765 [Flavobacterium psychrophilum]
MRYIFLDTNNWIYLSNGFNILNNQYDELHFKIFDFIIKKVNEGRLTFLTNRIILEEWERNKKHSQNQIDELNKKLHSVKASIKSIKHFLEPEGKEMAQSLKEKITIGIENKIRRHKHHIESVEEFLKKKTTLIEVSNHVKIIAADLAADRKAPFIGDKKNSMADALILLSSIEYVEKNLPIKLFVPESKQIMFPENYFVSSNKGDFSSDENPKIIHPDLKPYLINTDTQFYYSIADLVNNLESEFLTEEESDWIDSHYSKCPLCDFEYANTVEYSDPYKVYDPNKERLYENPNQLNFNFKEELGAEKTEVSQADLESDMVEAHCSHCNADFFVCPNCGELNEIEIHNEIFSCEHDCGYNFFLNTDIDKKGMIHGWEFEIVAGKICQKCNNKFLELSDSGLCEECEEFYATNN